MTAKRRTQPTRSENEKKRKLLVSRGRPPGAPPTVTAVLIFSTLFTQRKAAEAATPLTHAGERDDPTKPLPCMCTYAASSTARETEVEPDRTARRERRTSARKKEEPRSRAKTSTRKKTSERTNEHEPWCRGGPRRASRGGWTVPAGGAAGWRRAPRGRRGRS